ncbi:MAG: signal recognition particle-docking protein FtsY [Pseudomonadota bacterium]|nr:signal recognition particle-docking protein FtsY [Pseudomonadota bacterium]
MSEDKSNWLSRLRSGLQRSSTKISEGISGVFTKQRLDEERLLALEDLLTATDLGPRTAERLVTEFSQHRFGKDVSETEVKNALAEQIAALLEPVAVPLAIDPSHKPFVVLVAGVNGVGKTTTIGKLAHYYRQQGLKIVLAAGDTFRAAAVSQLKIWGERTGAPVFAGAADSDSAAVAYQALETARKDQADLLLIDTAGRLHNKGDLMQELAKLVRVLKKIDPTAPHATLLVLDATTGQNAHTQVEVFKTLTQITGLIVTKLDGSAKGGVLVALAEQYRLPIHAIGVGEGAEDLQPFSARDFAKSLMGLNS